jgi:hypothetical protein
MGAMWLKLSLVSGKADLFSVYVKKHLGQKSHQKEYIIGRMNLFMSALLNGRKKRAKTIRRFYLKGAQVYDFRPLVFYTNKSYLGI